jgi:hypothetical protein
VLSFLVEHQRVRGQPAASLPAGLSPPNRTVPGLEQKKRHTPVAAHSAKDHCVRIHESADRARKSRSQRTSVTRSPPARPSIRVLSFSPAMPEYVIEREIPGAGKMTEEQIRDVSVRSLEVLRGIGPQIQWLHSYVTDDRIYCVYLAPDEAAVREHAQRLGVPANRVSAVRRMIDPKRYA